VETDAELTEILKESRTVAVVGIKQGKSEDAYRIPKYMQEHGYTIVPINPKLDHVLGEKVRASLRELSDSNLEIDVVNLFRASEHLSAHVDEILEMSPRPKTVWMQLGIHHGASATRLRAAGIKVVQDRCIMVDHRRLLDAGDGRQSVADRQSATGNDTA
jgi:predicted CoA-binding protein